MGEKNSKLRKVHRSSELPPQKDPGGVAGRFCLLQLTGYCDITDPGEHAFPAEITFPCLEARLAGALWLWSHLPFVRPGPASLRNLPGGPPRAGPPG